MPLCCSCTCWTPSSSRKGPMKQGLSVVPSCCLLGCFLGIESLSFSEFRHGTRKLYQVVCARFFGKTFFAQKIGEVDNFPWISSIMKIYIISCVPVQIFYFEKMLFLRYRPMLPAIQIVRFLNQAFLQSKSMKQPHFLHVDTNSQKLKVDWKSFGRAWSKMSVANLVSGL